MRMAICSILLIAIVSHLSAQTPNIITVTTDTVEFWMGSGFTSEEAYTKALARAKRQAVEKAAATYIRSYTKAVNWKLTDDVVEAVQLGTVTEYEVLWKNTDVEESGVQRIVIRAVVECPSLEQLRSAVEGTQRQSMELQRGELSVQSFPADAKIYVNGEFSQERTPHVFRDLPEGNYDISLKLDGYATKNFTIRVEKTNPQYVSYILDRMKGRLKIQCSIPGSTVIIGKDTLGSSPVVTPDLLIGLYDLTVLGSEEYEPYTAEVEVVYGRESRINANLRKRPGRILVFTKPSGVFLHLEGTDISSVCEDSYLFRNIEPGAYRLVASKSGYSFQDTTVLVRPNRTEQIDIVGVRSVFEEDINLTKQQGFTNPEQTIQYEPPIDFHAAVVFEMLVGFPKLKEFNQMADMYGYGKHHTAIGCEVDLRINPGAFFGALNYEFSGCPEGNSEINTAITTHSFKVGIGYMNPSAGAYPIIAFYGGKTIAICSESYLNGTTIDSNSGSGFMTEFKFGFEGVSGNTIFGLAVEYKKRKIDEFDDNFVPVDLSGIYLVFSIGVISSD